MQMTEDMAPQNRREGRDYKLVVDYYSIKGSNTVLTNSKAPTLDSVHLNSVYR